MSGHLALALHGDPGTRGPQHFLKATVDRDGFLTVVDADHWLRQALDAGRVRWALFRGGRRAWRVVEIGARLEDATTVTLQLA